MSAAYRADAEQSMTDTATLDKLRQRLLLN
jgi:hypothetical protein